MRRSALFVLLAMACLAAIWSFATSAQIIDSDACQKACYEEQTDCETACGEHTNPVECEGRCEDQLEDCLERCR
jgi:hypothetical protein